MMGNCALPYSRVVVKVSGESLGASDPASVWDVSKSLVDAYALGVELALVVGGGNYVRGSQAGDWGVEPDVLDWSGMIATGLNAWNLAMVLRASGIPTRIFGRGPCASIESPYSIEALRTALEQREVAIIAGGMGTPGISTDVAAVHLAGAVLADAVVMSKFGVDGVYDSDPRDNPCAKKLHNLDASFALRQDLNVMDREALTLAIDHHLQVRVVPADSSTALCDVLTGATIGSTVHPR
jgi:uridylate kinase